METNDMKLPRSSYPELCKIIIGYSHCKEPSTLDELSRLTGIGRTVVSGNNAFLTAVGLIDGGKLKGPTASGLTLGRALDHAQPEEIAAAWRSVISGSDFLSKMILAVRIRQGMDEETFSSHIAFSAGEPKSPSTMAGARAIIETMLVAGFLRRDDDKIVVADASAGPSEAPTAQERVAGSPLETLFLRGSGPQASTPFLPAISISIQVRVDTKPDDLDSLAPKLLKLVNQLTAPDNTARKGTA